MKMLFTAAAAGLFAVAISPSAAAAQMGAPTGAEITGHAVQVDTGGVVNTVQFNPGGTARIVGQNGKEVNGQWFVQNQQLCLSAAGGQECWPYQAAFQAGQPVTLTSTCASTSTWTPLSTAPSAPPARSGERG
jgi:hypothetical protein